MPNFGKNGFFSMDKNEEDTWLNRNIKDDNRNYPEIQRDFEIVDCKASICRYNRSFLCTVPSASIIDKNGHCMAFDDGCEKIEKVHYSLLKKNDINLADTIQLE